jgi:hypothetical protein
VRPGRLELMIQHIGFAERWLARARAECTRGHVVRGALTLLLAEAEVHHAREAVTPTSQEAEVAPTPRLNRPLIAAAALMICVVAIILATGAGSGPLAVQDHALSPAPIVVRLRHDVGSVLSLVPSSSGPARDGQGAVYTAPVQQVRTPIERSVNVPPVKTDAASVKVNPPRLTKRVLSAGPAPFARRDAVKSTSRVRVARLERKRRLTAAPVSSPVSPSPSVAEPGVISDADLIDLVLAAERSLRSGSR